MWFGVLDDFVFVVLLEVLVGFCVVYFDVVLEIIIGMMSWFYVLMDVGVFDLMIGKWWFGEWCGMLLLCVWFEWVVWLGIVVDLECLLLFVLVVELSVMCVVVLNVFVEKGIGWEVVCLSSS